MNEDTLTPNDSTNVSPIPMILWAVATGLTMLLSAMTSKNMKESMAAWKDSRATVEPPVIEDLNLD